MSKDVKISSIQLFLMMSGFIFGSTAILNPASTAESDSWMAFILGWLGGIILIFIYGKISKLNSEKTLIEILVYNFGKYIGTIIGILYIWYFVHLAAMVFRNFGEFMVAVTYPRTPMIFIIICLALLVAYAVRSGLEVTARIAEITMMFLPLAIFILGFALITTHDLNAMFPLLKNGLSPVIKTGFTVLSFPFGETVSFMMIFPYLNRKKNIGKTAILAVVTAGFILFVVLLRDLITLGAGLLSEANYSPHMTARILPAISVEPLIDINFFIGGGIKTSTLVFCSAMGLTQLLGLKDYKPYVSAITVFCVVLSIWVYPNSVEMFRWANDLYAYYALPFQVIIPILLLIVSWIKSRKAGAGKG